MPWWTVVGVRARPVDAEHSPIRRNLAPGPSTLWPGLGEAARLFLESGMGGMNHRSPEISALVEELGGRLGRYLRLPEAYQLFFVSSGTYAMELILRNTVEVRCASFSAGAFGERFARVASMLGRRVDAWSLPAGRSLPSWLKEHGKEALASRLNQDAWSRAEAWLLCHNESATGTVLPLEMLPPLEETSPLRLVDGVSSVGACPLPWEQADVWFFGVQKAFGCPPGLCVLAVGPRALEKALDLERKSRDTGAWFSFARLEENGRRFQSPCTPNTLAFHLLNQAVRRMEGPGLEHWRHHCQVQRGRLMAWLDDHPVLEASVTSPEDRSLTVSALRRKDGAPLAAVQQALRQRGLVVGGGYGEWKGTGLRLAHFPAHDPADLDLVLTALDETLAEGGLS